MFWYVVVPCKNFLFSSPNYEISLQVSTTTNEGPKWKKRNYIPAIVMKKGMDWV
jgi:hypothetical protein